MAQAVDQLERTGYVERRPNPRDQRSRLVFLTERGRGRPAGHARGGQRAWRSGWAELTSPAEFEALRATLVRLLTALRDQPDG